MDELFWREAGILAGGPGEVGVPGVGLASPRNYAGEGRHIFGDAGRHSHGPSLTPSGPPHDAVGETCTCWGGGAVK
jgi:hypothetical protein